jgi:ABC-type antimicrobial peptide transport system permease subunit
MEEAAMMSFESPVMVAVALVFGLVLGLGLGWIVGATVGHAAGRAKEREEMEQRAHFEARSVYGEEPKGRAAFERDAEELRRAAAEFGHPVTADDRQVRRTPRKQP